MNSKKKLARLLAAVYEEMQPQSRKSNPKYERRKQDFVFHMTDWVKDLGELDDLYHHPENYSVDKATIMLIAILSHMVPHMHAAGRLLIEELPDPFENPNKSKKNRPGVKKTRARVAG